ncbi:MAG TPA: HlyD family efflux transporter periplasmic adaptor subunit [Bacteroidales bacterium]|nr:HlyD family efflux transporter periplasmic adaptor subunit [Bacteroidales bacterium]
MKKPFVFIVVISAILISSCMHKKSEDESSFQAYPNVKTTQVTYDRISDHVELNATARYLKTSVLSSPVAGYVVHAYAEQGRKTRPGEVLYTLQTRESRALEEKKGELNDTFGFKGVDTLRSNTEGYIAETYHQAGDFVTQGEKLLTMKEISSLVFVLDLPYEWNSLVKVGMNVSMVFPDESQVTGTVSRISPVVDPSNQTQKVVIAVKEPGRYPEGLIAKVSIPMVTSTNAALLPKSAVLTNETETEYWVMKMINDSVAVKVPVKTGIITHDTVQIDSPAFSKKDRILIYGNYAVPDTLQVTLTDSAR